ncbi:MAG: excinuclease ABC subunit C, partial [Candidatus Neomarinimicrobiota bacterium]
YIGSTRDLKRRVTEHRIGHTRSTKPYLPLRLTAYVAVEREEQARRLEAYFKTGSGKTILKKRILQTGTPAGV